MISGETLETHPSYFIKIQTNTVLVSEPGLSSACGLKKDNIPYVLKRVFFERKDCTKELKPECVY